MNTPEPRLTSLSHGGGCGCKLAPSVLQELLGGQPELDRLIRLVHGDAEDVGEDLAPHVGLATAAHQGFSTNLYTFPSDVFPRAAVGSVAGIGGTLGALGGMAFAKFIGQALDGIGTYTPIFVVAGCAYLAALAAIHILSPRMAPAKL